jgi:hypothetical protein
MLVAVTVVMVMVMVMVMASVVACLMGERAGSLAGWLRGGLGATQRLGLVADSPQGIQGRRQGLRLSADGQRAPAQVEAQAVDARQAPQRVPDLGLLGSAVHSRDAVAGFSGLHAAIENPVAGVESSDAPDEDR